MVAEIRSFDGNTVVAFVQDKKLMKTLRQRPECLKQIDYEQRGMVVAVDYYFPKSFKEELEKIVSGNDSNKYQDG